MSEFLSDLSRFYGTGEKNEAGQSLEEFLSGYDANKYPSPSCTTDAVVFRTDEPLKRIEQLQLLMIKRKNHPSIGYWALPGGFANMRENLDETARRELEEETGVNGLQVEQLATYGNYDRDPRTRVITTAYMSLIEGEDRKVCGADDAADACWCQVTLEQVEEHQFEERIAVKYRLRLKNEEKGLDTAALVERTVGKGLIREEAFTVLEQGMIAVDHAAIIVQAVTVLAERLEQIKRLGGMRMYS